MTGESTALVAALPMAAVLVDPSGRIAAANAAAEALFGMSLAGRHHVAALRQPDLLDAIAAVLSGAGTRTTRFRHRDGSRDLIFRVSVGPAALGPRASALAVFEDETTVEAADQMRRDFVANVSHELKTPLTALLGFVETLRTTARDDPEARERFLAIMAREAGRMDRLVADLLSLSRVEAEERVRPRQPVDLSAVVRRGAAAMAAMAEAAGVRLTVEGADAPVLVTGDADQLQQVLANLVENAIKYGGSGGRVTVRLGTGQGGEARIEVEDAGEGIDPAHLPRLTERFYRVDAHRSRAAGGTGLGLAIVKHIVSRHRGRLLIESRPGQGSRFTVILPGPTP